MITIKTSLIVSVQSPFYERGEVNCYIDVIASDFTIGLVSHKFSTNCLKPLDFIGNYSHFIEIHNQAIENK